MVERGFLKTATFGGFDKKDVLEYVDQLNQKIFNAETELEYTRKKLAEANEVIMAKDREICELKKQIREQYYNSSQSSAE